MSDRGGGPSLFGTLSQIFLFFYYDASPKDVFHFFGHIFVLGGSPKLECKFDLEVRFGKLENKQFSVSWVWRLKR